MLKFKYILCQSGHEFVLLHGFLYKTIVFHMTLHLILL